MVVAAAVVGAKTLLPKIDGSRAMCAEFTDAAGLYTGNKVQLLGIDVGSITAITNEPDHVEVDFTVRKISTCPPMSVPSRTANRLSPIAMSS